MCCRFAYYERALEDVEELATTVDDGVYGIPFGDIGPMDSGVILRGEVDIIRADTAGFGWLQSDDHTLMINARSETVEEKPTFGESFTYHRCVIPANLYYEWNSNKEKARFSSPADKTLFLAGIFDVRENRLQFTILTRDADDIMSPVHDRMPVIVSKDAIHSWLFDLKSAGEIMTQTQEKLVRSMEYEQLSFFNNLM